jgi:hypothetical protein
MILFTGDLICREGANCKQQSALLQVRKEQFGSFSNKDEEEKTKKSDLKSILNEEEEEFNHGKKLFEEDNNRKKNNTNDQIFAVPDLHESNRGDISVVTRGAVSIHSTNTKNKNSSDNNNNNNTTSTASRQESYKNQTAENIVCEETAGQALIVGAFEFGLNAKEYLTTVRCASVCEVWTLPAASLERRLRRDHPLIWSALDRIPSDSSAVDILRQACRQQFDQPNFLVFVEHWPSSVGVYLPPRDELVEWRQNRHRSLKQ